MIKFVYDINKDAQNWVETVKDIEPSWGIDYKKEIEMVSKDLKQKILKSNKKKAILLVKDYFKSLPYFSFKKEIIFSEIKAIEKVWGKKEKQFFEILEKITRKPIFLDKFTAYFTTMFICPYDEKHYKWFMLSMWHSIPFQITTICHEILHFQFLYYYADFCKRKGLKKKQIETLKESLTILLNAEEFNNIILSIDVGYPNHHALRKKILNTWQKNKNLYLKNENGFEFFLERIIESVEL